MEERERRKSGLIEERSEMENEKGLRCVGDCLVMGGEIKKNEGYFEQAAHQVDNGTLQQRQTEKQRSRKQKFNLVQHSDKFPLVILDDFLDEL